MVVSPYRSNVQDQRLEAFERIRRAFRWTVAGAVTAVLGIVGVVAHEIPGRSASGATSSNASPAAGTAYPITNPAVAGSTGSPSGANASVGGRSLRPPVTAPTPTQRAPTAVSGGTGW